MLTKEQMLGNDFGTAPDQLFWNGGASYAPSNARYIPLGDYTKAFKVYYEYKGLAATTRTFLLPTGWQGMQRFASDNRPIPKYNYCWNSKARLTCHPILYMTGYTSKWPLQETGRMYYLYSLPGGTSSVLDLGEGVDWSESAFASNRAWWSMQPRFEGDFDGLNFLFELKDFKTIAKHIIALRPSQIHGTFKRVKRAIQRSRRAVETGTATRRITEIASAATRTAAEGVLIKHFAIDPTVRDLMGLHAQLQQLVSDVQHRFRDKGLEGNTRHYSETISESDNRAAYQAYGSILAGTHKKDVFTATMGFSYDYKLRGTFDALKRYYGMQVTAGVVWNAIPFSFLVDYFCKVGDAIENMTVDPNVVLNLHQYCESRLITATSGLTWGGSGTYPTFAVIINGEEGRVDQPITAYTGSLYERRVVPPSKGMALPRVKLPSVKQAVNIAALVRCMW
jgi:hypothetical protein